MIRHYPQDKTTDWLDNLNDQNDHKQNTLDRPDSARYHCISRTTSCTDHDFYVDQDYPPRDRRRPLREKTAWVCGGAPNSGFPLPALHLHGGRLRHRLHGRLLGLPETSATSPRQSEDTEHGFYIRLLTPPRGYGGSSNSRSIDPLRDPAWDPAGPSAPPFYVEAALEDTREFGSTFGVCQTHPVPVRSVRSDHRQNAVVNVRTPRTQAR